MLSLNNGTKIAKINDDDKFVYIKDAEKNAKSEVATTEAKKFEIFKNYIERDKKIRRADIDNLIYAYKHNTKPNPKLERKFEDGINFIDTSLKHYLDFGRNYTLHPYIDKKAQPTYRMFVSGLSGSGKSYFIAQFLKTNKPKHIFLFSPVQDDPAFKKLKPEPLHLNLASYAEEFEKEFEIEDIPPDSVVIMDDIDTAKDAKAYQEIKVQLLERGRHIGISTIIVSHQALGGNIKHAKAQLLECEFFVIFPRSNRAHAEKLLLRYVGVKQEKADEILDLDSRAVVVKKSYPAYFIGEHTIGTIN